MDKATSMLRDEQQRELIAQMDSEFGVNEGNSEEIKDDADNSEIEMEEFGSNGLDNSNDNSWLNSLAIY